MDKTLKKLIDLQQNKLKERIKILTEYFDDIDINHYVIYYIGRFYILEIMISLFIAIIPCIDCFEIIPYYSIDNQIKLYDYIYKGKINNLDDLHIETIKIKTIFTKLESKY
jgi:hypothetical protein